MLAHILALVVGFSSFVLYMAAFFYPEVHRKNDFIWSGIGMFYALVLWVYAGRITGGILLGQAASVTLLGWLGWQTLKMRRDLTPYDQQTWTSGSSKSLGDTLMANASQLPTLAQQRWQQLPLPAPVKQAPAKATALFNTAKETVQGWVGRLNKPQKSRVPVVRPVGSPTPPKPAQTVKRTAETLSAVKDEAIAPTDEPRDTLPRTVETTQDRLTAAAEAASDSVEPVLDRATDAVESLADQTPEAIAAATDATTETMKPAPETLDDDFGPEDDFGTDEEVTPASVAEVQALKQKTLKAKNRLMSLLTSLKERFQGSGSGPKRVARPAQPPIVRPLEEPNPFNQAAEVLDQVAAQTQVEAAAPRHDDEASSELGSAVESAVEATRSEAEAAPGDGALFVETTVASGTEAEPQVVSELMEAVNDFIAEATPAQTSSNAEETAIAAAIEDLTDHPPTDLPEPTPEMAVVPDPLAQLETEFDGMIEPVAEPAPPLQSTPESITSRERRVIEIEQTDLEDEWNFDWDEPASTAEPATESSTEESSEPVSGIDDYNEAVDLYNELAETREPLAATEPSKSQAEALDSWLIEALVETDGESGPDSSMPEQEAAAEAINEAINEAVDDEPHDPPT